MSDMRLPDPSAERQLPRQRVLYHWSAAILLVGLAAAALIYAFTGNDEAVDAAGEISSDRMYEHNLQLMGGKFAVYADRFGQWFDALWHGRELAYTVAVLSIAVALLCFCVARLISVPLPRKPDARREADR